ncbi:MAG: hypothetical protein A2289_21470 [Deltaproteobacteria bacterium RIFOXYA12_FULL_58_15]|nr:MAG: hypothetical protein A2289_21470 [Deltaproteobacteria bacterium RIFOXYA12_FULL_58_15]OGR11887.1 MAG: hypothetical protein A2341_17110 [Deltaproteobacteria bacterium RIFOXYB12_FULL_58_9]
MSDVPISPSVRQVEDRQRFALGLAVATAVAIGATVGTLALDQTEPPQDRQILVRARQYAYDPPVIRANRGDRLFLKLVALDVVHGFFLEGYDLDVEITPQQNKFKVRHPSRHDDWAEQEEVIVVVDKPGKFRFRCSHTCGSLHPFMSGELIVEPNHVLHAGLGAGGGLFLGSVVIAWRRAHRASRVRV